MANTSAATTSKGASPRPPDSSAWKRLTWSLVGLIIFIVIAVVGYRLIEHSYDWFDAVYMTVISISTVGYREVHPLTPVGQIWTIFVIAGGLILGAVVISLVVSVVVEGRVRRLFGRKDVEKKISNTSGHTIVCGYGRMGSIVADELSSAGWDVVVVESDPQRVAEAEQAGLLAIQADAEEEDTLLTAGVERAKALVSVLKDDADNLFVILSARQANPDIHIVCRAQQEASQHKMLRAGANSVVCPQTICARRLAGLIVHPAGIEFADMAQRGLNLEVNQLTVAEGSQLADKTLAELELPRRLGTHVVAVRRSDGQAVYHPGPQTKVAVGDTLVLIGETGSSEAIERLREKSV